MNDQARRIGSVQGTRAASTKRPAKTLVAILASAGGLESVTRILSELPMDLHAAVAIVEHRPTASRDSLAMRLQRATGLPVKLAEEGESLFTSMVYVAAPYAHLTVLVDGSVCLLDGPRIRHVLSSAKPLFESAPDAFGANVVAVVLRGGNIDGTDGVQRVADAGGRVITEDPSLPAIPHRIVQFVEERRERGSRRT